MAQIYVKLMNLIEAFSRDGFGRDALEHDLLLSHLYQQRGQTVLVGDLLRADRFGTLPTIQKRLRRLVELGLVETERGDDRRTRVVKISAEGERHLCERSVAASEALRS